MSKGKNGCTRRAFMVLGGAAVGVAAMPAVAHAARHPKIAGAIDALQEAREYLQKADHDFHGHRKEALRKLNDAIDELKICMKM
jgi:hypothetical protein